jgi:hypothetical protein
MKRDIGELLHDILKQNLDHRIKSAKKGIPTTFVVYGPQRSGKSTLAIQSGAYCAQQLGKEFSVDNVFFNVDDFLKASVGNVNGVYVIDEAAFDLMGVDWHKEGAKKLLKYLLTGAKYGQIVFFLIPRLEKMTRNVVDDHHCLSMEIFLSRDASSRSYSLYNNEQTRLKYKLLKDFNYVGAKRFTYLHNDWRFLPDLDFIDEPEYQKRKDLAIKAITEDQDGEKANKKLIAVSNKLTDLRRRIMNMKDKLKEEGYDVSMAAIARSLGYKGQSSMDHFKSDEDVSE